MADHIDGKVIVITGGGRGFGRLVAEKTAARGARVVVSDVAPEGIDEAAQAIEAAGGAALARVADVTDLAAMHALADAALAEFGRIDVLVNNAGVMPLAFFGDHAQAADRWARCIDVNFRGVLNGIAAVHDAMIGQGRGHVINLSSIYGNQPVAGAGVYGATKAAVNFLSESLRQESQGRIKVTTIRPTGVPGTALGEGIVNPEAIAGILGVNQPRFMEEMTAVFSENPPPELASPDSIEYAALAPELLADQIVYAIDQPWGVSISDLTVRASGDRYVI